MLQVGATEDEEEDKIMNMVAKPEVKKPLERPSRRWEGCRNMHLEEIG
jgi:hypothetical protein